MFSTNNCILCLKASDDIIQIYSSHGRASKIAEILEHHFWFRLDKSNEYPKGICSHCWKITETFDNFYKSVQAAHSHLLIDDFKQEDIDSVEDSIKIEPDYAVQLSNFNSFLCAASLGNQDVPNEPKRNANSDVSSDGDAKRKESHDEQTYRRYQTKPREKKKKLSEKHLKSRDRTTKVQVKQRSESPATVTNEKLKKDIRNEAVELKKRIGDYFKMQCDLCQHKFDSLNNVGKHFKDEHNIIRGYLKCCDRAIHVPNGVIEHIAWHLNPNIFQCTICPRVCNARHRLTTHIRSHSQNQNLECDKCQKCFLLPQQLNQHVSAVHAVGDFTCDICQKKYKTKLILRTHIINMHEQVAQHICDICAKKFKTKRNLLEHVMTHKQMPRLQCSYCSAWLKNNATLQKHLKRHTDPNRQRICDICFKVKPSQNALNSHKRVVHGEKSFQCSLCDKAFSRAMALREHIASHTGECLFTCPHCPKSFQYKTDMYKHKRNMHLEEWEASKKTNAN